ncbi:aminobutyraldehyde dehydrogenase [hydrocarbon metagenome]|uniref:Aminobutyraldehyde dehydrogenase n=1 Tax=hydrocarbon metagenome TaxID=938273 RepID=A0A0W8E4G9_9ZZZZ
MDKLDIVIIGAGVVGLAIACELALKTNNTLAVIESNRKIGQGVSSRNSQVIHSGVYYAPDMLKSILCIKGNRSLYKFCENNKILHQRCGKLIISVDDMSRDSLDLLYTQVKQKEIKVIPLSKQEAAVLEPEINTSSALLFPDSGTIDVQELMQALYYNGRQSGVVYLFDSTVHGAAYTGSYYQLETDKEIIKAQMVINSAGLRADTVASMLGIEAEQAGYKLRYCKGEYFQINRKLNVNRLIYPLPGENSLGIHLSHDSQRRLRLGPNAHYVNDIDYHIDNSHKEEFFEAASRYIPNLKWDDLSPDFAGIRPKLQALGEEMRDFIIVEEDERGFPGWINLIGIESPGLTSCLAIAEYVRNIVSKGRGC